MNETEERVSNSPSLISSLTSMTKKLSFHLCVLISFEAGNRKRRLVECSAGRDKCEFTVQKEGR